ncbi:MAG: hypothetical protein IKI76_09735 [Selenomonadaceae bacterium]|nr:hypothetical protein [Selenomonadaceae bacterium]
MWARVFVFKTGTYGEVINDDRWLREWGGLEIIFELGFRVYEHEDFDYFFEIDGASYVLRGALDSALQSTRA